MSIFAFPKIWLIFSLPKHLTFFYMKGLVLFLIIAVVLAVDVPTPGKKVLVVLENEDFKSTHSEFFNNLIRNSYSKPY